MSTSHKSAVITAMAIAQGYEIEGKEYCLGDDIRNRKHKKLPSPKLKRYKHKRNKKRGY